MPIARSAVKTATSTSPSVNGGIAPPAEVGPPATGPVAKGPQEPTEVVVGAAAETVSWQVVVGSVAVVAIAYAIV
jgi:hypothetical protein